VNDLSLGIRLAVGGGRTSWVRLLLTAAGVGLGVAVLLSAASVPHMLQARDDRTSSRYVPSLFEPGDSQTTPVPGVDPVIAARRDFSYQGTGLTGSILTTTGPHSPSLPGVRRLPGPGEAVLSPALRKLLDSPEGRLLRPRFSQRVIGTIGDDGLSGPNELAFYVGVPDLTIRDQDHTVGRLYHFGAQESPRTLDGFQWLLIVVGAASFLIPVVVFVATSTRLAAAARDRRLAALRLVGADGRQVRRIASGEAFVGALAGLLVGAAMFLVIRVIAPDVTLNALNGGVFSSDIRPEWALVGLIVVTVPILAVGIATLSLRRTIIEPLFVVRRATHGRRTLWWRLLPTVAGVALLARQAGNLSGALGESGQRPVIAGVVLLLVSVPVLLPWIVERVVHRLPQGSPAWQLAIRRLQLDSATSARVVSGVAVVLTGVIALQSLLLPAQDRYTGNSGRPVTVSASVTTESLADAHRFVSTARGVSGISNPHASTSITFTDGAGKWIDATIGSCDDLRALAVLPRCADGDVFAVTSTGDPAQSDVLVPVPGQRLWSDGQTRSRPTDTPQWTVPANLVPAKPRDTGDDTSDQLLITEAAAAVIRVGQFHVNVQATTDGDRNSDEYLRNALVPFGWGVDVNTSGGESVDPTYSMISRVLIIGTVITLLLATASLVVVALEQIRERRRSLAVLMANGVRRKVLAVSLLWQAAIPIVLAVALAVVAGLGLAVLLFRLVRTPIGFDWPTIGAYGATALAAVLLAAVCTLPALWRAASMENLRGE
jgi:hypothetical protein